MITNQIFNLEKIKEILNPIDGLQGNLNSLRAIYDKFIENNNNIIKNFSNEEFLNQIQEINQILKNINENLIKISNENISKFLVFQDDLIKKYKDSFIDSLKKIKLERNKTKEIGLNLIENKKISKVIDQSSFLFSIAIKQWLDLLESLKQNSLFLSTLKRVEFFYSEILKKRLKHELTKIPDNIDPNLIKDFEKGFLSNPMTFKEFLQEIESKLTQKEIKAKREIIEKTKEDGKLKEKQELQFQSFEDYFKFSDKEFERRMRKKKREKLSDLVEKQEEVNKIQITEEVSEKIEKFKSKFESDEDFLIKRDNDKDPLDLIRERKRSKDKEYKEHIKKFKSKEK